MRNMRTGIGLSLVLLGMSTFSGACLADEVVFDDRWDVSIEESMPDDGGGVTGTYSDGDLGITDDGEAEAADDQPLFVEEDAFEVVQEGADLEEVLQAEEEAERAALAVQDFMDRGPLIIPQAEPGSLAEYLKNLLETPSPTGSDGELLTGRYITSVMKDLGYTVSEQSFHEGFLNEDFVDVPGVNLLAERGADSENRTSQIVLLCAHYDSKRLKETSGEDPLENDKTGVAVLLETARVLADIPTDVDLCFLFLSGEEDGNFGSQRFVEYLEAELKSDIRAVICIGPAGYKKIERDPAASAEDPEEIEEESSTSAEEEISEEESAPSKEKPSASREEQEASEITVLPYLLATKGGAENEPASLLRATALQHRAEAMLSEGIMPEDESEMPEEEGVRQGEEGVPQDEEGVSQGEEGGMQEDGSAEQAKEDAAFAQEKTGQAAEDILQAAESAVLAEESWKIVPAEGGMSEAFIKDELPTVYLYQEIPQTENTQVWLDVPELTAFADLLAQTLSLYMQLP